MAWMGDLRPASFRGVPFNVSRSAVTVGRRQARHEYPQRNEPYVEDMGRKAREYKVDALVLGDDYLYLRDDLIAALEEEGPGQLVHPYYGTRWVTVSGDCQVEQSTREGGMASVSILFLEAGEQLEPADSVDTEVELEEQLEVTDQASADDFAENFSIDGAPDFVVQDAMDQVGGVMTLPGFELGDLTSIRSEAGSSLNALLPENLLTSLLDPVALAAGLLALFDRGADVAPVFDYATSMRSSSVPATTSSRAQQSGNRMALGDFLEQVATSHHIVALSSSMPMTVDDVRSLRQEIVTRTDDVIFNERIGDRSADAAVQLRTDALNHLAATAVDLPGLVSITNQAVLPSVVVAHDLYGDNWLDAGRADQLIERNRIVRPGFVPGGVPLQVLSE